MISTSVHLSVWRSAQSLQKAMLDSTEQTDSRLVCMVETAARLAILEIAIRALGVEGKGYSSDR